MKTDIFNFRRFGKYLASDIRTCLANYGLTLLSLTFIVLLVTYAVTVGMNLLFDHVWEGPELTLRVTEFTLAFFVTVILAPTRCYGKITEKQYGSFWLTLPASKLEKFISMTLIISLMIPLIAAILFLSADALICAIDSTCGESIISGARNLLTRILEIKVSGTIDGDVIPESAVRFINQMTNPLLYLDDFIGLSLPFLLGAVFFKKNKIAKTFIAMIAISAAASAILTPYANEWSREMMQIAKSDIDPETLFSMGIFRHAALLDTISDTVTNIVLLAAIYFRIKTLKH